MCVCRAARAARSQARPRLELDQVEQQSPLVAPITGDAVQCDREYGESGTPPNSSDTHKYSPGSRGQEEVGALEVLVAIILTRADRERLVPRVVEISLNGFSFRNQVGVEVDVRITAAIGAFHGPCCDMCGTAIQVGCLDYFCALVPHGARVVLSAVFSIQKHVLPNVARLRRKGEDYFRRGGEATVGSESAPSSRGEGTVIAAIWSALQFRELGVWLESSNVHADLTRWYFSAICTEEENFTQPCLVLRIVVARHKVFECALDA